MTRGGAAWSDRRLEAGLGAILRLGVLAAAAVVAAGGVIYLLRHGAEPVSRGLFQGEPERFRSAAGILRSAFSGSGRGIIQLGLLILIATPVARVAFAVIGFVLERDWLYVAVTALVLGFLLLSLGGFGPL